MPFDRKKIADAIYAAARSVGGEDRQLADELTAVVTLMIDKRFGDGEAPHIEDIQDLVEKTLIETGHAKTAKAYILYRQRRAELREKTRVRKEAHNDKEKNSTDIHLLVDPGSKAEYFPWDKSRISAALVKEAWLDADEAADIAGAVEKRILASGMSRISSYLLRELTPAMAKGQLYPDAAMADPARLVDGLARKLSRSFYGPGRELAAQAVAQAALFGATAPNGDVLSQGFMNGGQVNVEELIATLAFSPGSDANDPTIASLRSWYSGNVAMDLQFGERRAKLRDSLLSDGIPDAQARMIVSSASSLAAQNLSRGIDPSFVFDNAESQGVYLTLKDGTDAEGKPAKVVGYAQGNRDKASIPLDDEGKDVLPEGTFLSNRALWTQVQQMLTARLKREAAKADYAARQRIKNAGKEPESQLD